MSTAVHLERIPYDAETWETIVANHPDAEVFHGSPWLRYLAATQSAEPVIAVVRSGGRPVGYFVGAIVRRYGVRILGSPLRGWSTQAMGFLLEDGVDRRAAAEALVTLAFDKLGCVHVELADRHLTAEQMAGAGYACERGTTFQVDLSKPADAIFDQIRRTTRQEIRKAMRAGLHAEIATDREFEGEFYGYLGAVFRRQSLAPTYGPERVRSLIDVLSPAGQLIRMRIRGPDGRTLGTSLSVGRGGVAVAWGVAFDRENEEFHAVELLWWETIRAWHAAGAQLFDLGGGGEYKAKYGGRVVPTAHFHRSRWPALNVARSTVRGLVRARQRVVGRRSRVDAGRTSDAVIG